MGKQNIFGMDGEEGHLLSLTSLSDTTAHISTPVWDMRTLDGISFQLVTTGTLSGTWVVEVSNNATPASSSATSISNIYGQELGAGTWTDITASFTTPAITNPAGSPTNQYVQASPLTARAIRVTFTRSAGSGNVNVYAYGKGNF
jgi:hypothetical protein